MSSPGSLTEKDIKQLWEAAIQPVEAQAGASAEKALGFQRNFEFNLMKAFKAAYDSVSFERTLEHPNMHDPAWVLKTAYQAVTTGWSVMTSLCQAVSPIAYVTLVVLSGSENGMEAGELQTKVEGFLKDPKAERYAWYLGMTPDLARRAREAAGLEGEEQKGWLDRALAPLQKEGFVTANAGKLIYKSRNFTFGWWV